MWREGKREDTERSSSLEADGSADLADLLDFCEYPEVLMMRVLLGCHWTECEGEVFVY